MDAQAIGDLTERYSKVYSGAVADVLDKRGYRNQIVDGAIQGHQTPNDIRDYMKGWFPRGPDGPE